MDVMHPDTVTPRRLILGRLSAVVGVAGIVTGVVALIATQLDVDHNIVIVLASVAPLLMIAPLIGAVVSGIGRQWIVCAASLVVLALFGWSVSPLYISGTDESTSANGPSIRMMQANLMIGTADPESLVAMVRESNVDVVTVQELTYQEVDALEAAGLEEVLSHQFLVPYADGGGGAGIYSRFPLSNPRSLDGFSPETLSAELNVGLARPVTLFAVHPAPAYISPASVWAAEQQKAWVLHGRSRRDGQCDSQRRFQCVVLEPAVSESPQKRIYQRRRSIGFRSDPDLPDRQVVSGDGRYRPHHHQRRCGDVPRTDRDQRIRSSRTDCRHHVVLSKYWIEHAPGHGYAPVLTSSVVAVHAAVGGLFPPIGC